MLLRLHAGGARWWIIAATIVVAALAACSRQVSPPAYALDERVFVFLECLDCMSGERERVILMGDSAVPSLQLALLRGPDPKRVAALARALGQRSIAVSSPGLATRQVEVYRGSYWRRAAGALRDIGGPLAQRALCESKAARASPGLDRAYLDSAIARAGAGCP